MNTTDPGSLLTPAICLLTLVIGGAGLLLALLKRASRPRSSRGQGYAGTPRLDTAVTEPRHSSAEGSHSAGTEDAGFGRDEAPPPPAAELPYLRKNYLLTQAERDFFAVLRAAAPQGWYVFPQVRLANLIMLKKGTRNWKPHYSRVAQKCVDFVLCDDADIGPRLVIELDDSSHDRPDRQARDAFVDAALHAAGLPILHVRWQRRYDPVELALQIRAAAGLLSLAPAISPATSPPSSTPHNQGRPATVAAGPGSGPTSWACRSCGPPVGATAKFCTRCGAMLEL